MRTMTKRKGWVRALLIGLGLVGVTADAWAQYGGVTPNAPYDQSRRVARRTARRTTRRNTDTQEQYQYAPAPPQQQAPAQPMPQPQQQPPPAQQPVPR
jgi:hypothetical protein